MKPKYRYNIGDLLVKNCEPTPFCPGVGYVVKVCYSLEEPEEIIVKWFGKFTLNHNQGYYMPSQLAEYNHYPVKE